MITTVTLNPCIDRTVYVDTLKVGDHNVSSGFQTDASGKGINTSMLLKQLGYDTLCLGFAFSNGGDALRDKLDAAGISYILEDVDGELRMNLKITELSRGRMTEINEKGSPVPDAAVSAVLEKLRAHVPHTDILVVSGSAPANVPADVYASMIRIAKSAGKKTVLDASDALLREGLKAKPWLIKPNKLELETLLGAKITSVERAAEMARDLARSGVELVCVSLGGKGAVLASEEEAWFSPCVDIPIRGVQGAGDSMVAGLCIAALEGLSLPDMLRYAVAAAHGSLIMPGTQMCTKDGFERMLPLITAQTV